jgi:hypothetical protein
MGSPAVARSGPKIPGRNPNGQSGSCG